MADLAGMLRPDCSECGRPLLFVAELAELGLRQHISVFKCTVCSRIHVVKDEVPSDAPEQLVDQR